MSVNMLRSEITDVGKSLVDLNKLKVVLASGLLAVAFGIGSTNKVGDYSFLVLTLIPFVCLYVDFQFYHGLARIFVIARFLENADTSSAEERLVQNYERFVTNVRMETRLFGFEGIAQFYSSLGLAVICPLLGILSILSIEPTIATRASSQAAPSGIAASAPSAIVQTMSLNTLAGKVVVGSLSFSIIIGTLLIGWFYREYGAEKSKLASVKLPVPPPPASRGALSQSTQPRGGPPPPENEEFSTSLLDKVTQV